MRVCLRVRIYNACMIIIIIILYYYICGRMPTCMRKCVRANVRTHVHMRLHGCEGAHVRVCVCACWLAYERARVCSDVYVCTYVHAKIYMRTCLEAFVCTSVRT